MGASIVVGILYGYCAYCYDENGTSHYHEKNDFESKWKSSIKYHSVTEYEKSTKPRKNLSQTSHYYKESTSSISKRERIIGKSACVFALEEEGILEKKSDLDETAEGFEMRIDLIQQLLNEKSSKNMDKTVRSFLIGAIGELKTLISLIGLDDEYFIINDLSLEFNPPFWDRDSDEPICSTQIDHVVVGPTGVFVIESKYWSHSIVVDQLSSDFTPLMQARRNGKSVWFCLNDEMETTPFVKSIISLGGSASFSGNKWVDVILAKDIAKNISRRRKRLTSFQVDSIVDCLLE